MASERVGHCFRGHLPQFLGVCESLQSASLSLSYCFCPLSHTHVYTAGARACCSFSPILLGLNVLPLSSRPIWYSLPLRNEPDACVRLMVPETSNLLRCLKLNKILF